MLPRSKLISNFVYIYVHPVCPMLVLFSWWAFSSRDSVICMLPNIQTVYAKQSSSQEEARVKFSSVLFKDSLGDPLTLKRRVPGNCGLKQRSVLTWKWPLTFLRDFLRMRIWSFLDFVKSCICKALMDFLLFNVITLWYLSCFFVF